MRTHTNHLLSLFTLAAVLMTAPGSRAQSTPTGPGTLALSSATANVAENAGRVVLTLSRTGGSSGVVSVSAATADGTAKAGTDYSDGAQTVSWDDGDTADKTLPIAILDPGVTDGNTRTFTVTLSDPSGGAVLGSPVTATVSILDNDALPQPTVEITSPPADTTVVSGAAVTIAVSVSDPAGIVSNVAFFLNDQPYAQTSSKGPFALKAVAPQPGTYVIKAVVTDDEGRTNTSTRTVTVIAPSTTDPAPAADFFGGLDGRTVAGADTIVLVASAQSLSPDGTPLAEISFYADNDLIATFDGGGNPVASGRSQPGGGRRPAAASPIADARPRRLADVEPASAGTVYSTPWTVPNVDKLINLLIVAKTASGISQVSAPMTVTAAATSATSNHAPIAELDGLTSGEVVTAGTAITVPVTANDPDGGSTSAFNRHRHRTSASSAHRRLNAVGDPGSVISQVEYYLNQVKVATSTTAPYSASITPPSAGTYVVEAIVTDDAGLSGVANPVTIQAVNIPVATPPTVTLSLPGGTAAGNKTSLLEGGPTLKVRVTRDGTDFSQPLAVSYKAKGPNVPGTDYKALSGTVTIPAGAASAKIKIHAFDDGVADGNKTLKLRLTPSADNLYNVGPPVQIKIRIIDLQGVQ